MARSNTRSIEYDDQALRKFFAEMDPKQRTKVLRGGFRTMASTFRKAAINNLRAEMNSNADLEKGVRAIVFKQTLGFRVTVGTTMRRTKDRHGWQGVHGFYANRQVRKNPTRYSIRPVLIWAEDGTVPRRTKGERKVHKTERGFRKAYAYNGAYRGRMRRYAFMVKAKEQTASSLTQKAQESLIKYTVKIAKKYGCAV